MRKIIAALQVSVDGFVEGPEGELDWAMEEDEETWKAVFEMLESIDACVMYPDYEQYWMSILANPTGIPSFSGKQPTIAFIRGLKAHSGMHRIIKNFPYTNT